MYETINTKNLSLQVPCDVHNHQTFLSDDYTHYMKLQIMDFLYNLLFFWVGLHTCSTEGKFSQLHLSYICMYVCMYVCTWILINEPLVCVFIYATFTVK